jgi:hypothetical protein
MTRVYFSHNLWQILSMKNLKEIRNELLRLHKTLLEIEKANYEAEFGKVSPNQLFQLLFDNDRFIWLRSISSTVVEIDEMFANKTGIDEALANDLYVKVGLMFDESTEFADFKTKYQANLDIETEVAFHHIILQKLLAKEKA